MIGVEAHRHVIAEVTRAQLALGEASLHPDAAKHSACLERERAALQVASVLAQLAEDHAHTLARIEELIRLARDHDARIARMERPYHVRLYEWVTTLVDTLIKKWRQ